MVKKVMMATLILVLIGLLCSCLSPKESFIKKGAVLLTQKEIAEILRGNTMVSSDWIAFYREDGIRVLEVYGKGTYHLKWSVDPRGRFCTESLSKGMILCNLKVYRLGGQYKVFDGGTIYAFKVEPGNSRNLK